MKEGWEYKRMDEVCSIARGGSPRPIKDYITNDPNGLNWIKIGDTDMGGKYIYSTKEKIKPEGLKKSRWVEEDEFLLSNSMSFGRPYILKTNGCIHDGWLVLRDYQKYLNIDFFYYVLSSENVQRQFRIKAQGSTVSNLNTDRVASVTIPIPPLSEQQSIVDYLDSAFAKIDAMKANAEKRFNEAQALFQASLKKMLEPKEGWEDKALKDFATDMYRGSGVKRDQVTEDGISCVRYGEIYTKYNYHFNECDSHTLEEYVNSPKYFEYGDILFAITGESVEEIGKSIAYTGKDKCIAGGDIVVMKHNYEPRYISYALSTPSAIKQKGRGKTKLKVVHTNIPSLKEIIIPIAPVNEQIIIADTLDSLKSKVDRLQANYDKISQECDALKQAILRQVFE